jgi:hypothetical protein
LNKKEVIKEDKLAIVDLNKDIAPFSFLFQLYRVQSDCILIMNCKNILRKDTQPGKAFFDILLKKYFCVVFGLTLCLVIQKALIQNLEYIADQKQSKY